MPTGFTLSLLLCTLSDRSIRWRCAGQAQPARPRPSRMWCVGGTEKMYLFLKRIRHGPGAGTGWSRQRTVTGYESQSAGQISETRWAQTAVIDYVLTDRRVVRQLVDHQLGGDDEANLVPRTRCRCSDEWVAAITGKVRQIHERGRFRPWVDGARRLLCCYLRRRQSWQAAGDVEGAEATAGRAGACRSTGGRLGGDVAVVVA